ncbi:MAG: exopolyphosphatase, partial [Hyphomicrobiales bacterium]|nr:exopolyphosphatase [Hyphomicrobiales bacterium]
EEEQPGPRLRSLVDLDTFRNAMLLGAALRLAYRLSASMPGILPRTGFARKGDTVQFLVPRDMEDLVSDRVESRLKRVAKISSLAAEIIVYG